MKKIRLAVLAFVLAGSGGVQSQTVSFDAVKLADVFISNSWEGIAPLLEAAVAKLEVDLRNQGATEKAAKVLSDSLAQSMNKDNMNRAMAEMISERLNPAEQRELMTFLQSSLGQKYLSLSKGGEANTRFLGSIFKQACESANAQLGFFDRGSINRACASYK